MMEEVEQKRGQMMAELLEEIEITRKKRGSIAINA